ncbi:hypothetical protein C0J52_23117 [Blattella germanica]|nr:hypothetical protein C0J52_23117 [Blattella germanica]
MERKLCNLDIDNENGIDGEPDNSEPVTYCVQALLAIEVLLNPSSDTQMFVNELLMVQRLKGYNLPRLYAEIMRACLITLNDVQGTGIESQWGAFTFLKVPHVLRQIHFTSRGSEIGGDSTEKLEYSQDVVDALELLLQYTPLLDIMDAKCACNCLECLLKELLRNGLVTENHVSHFTSKRSVMTLALMMQDYREAMSATMPKLEQSPAQTPSIPKVIVRAEPTLARILKTLDADSVKVQEPLLSVLCQVLTGKSFELILAVAAVEGKLRTLVSKLLKFNECSKQVGVEGSKPSPQTRAMLFDVTFLMLCSIEVLKFRYQEDLDRAVDLAFGVFHLDVEHCTLALLLQVLPQYLHNQMQSEELVEPQASALAKLCAYCVFAALEFQNNTTPGQVNSRKRSWREMEGELKDLEALCPSSKLLRMTSVVPETADTAALFGTGTTSTQNSTRPYNNNNQPTTIKEPLQKALNDLFHTFTVISGRDGEVSQQTHFVCKFLQYVVRCGRDRTRLVLQGMPNTLVPCLLRSLPDLFTTDLLLRLYDINTVAGRKATARDLCMLRNMNLKMSMKDIM